jgi:uncharacterized protein (DUF3084 family)
MLLSPAVSRATSTLSEPESPTLNGSLDLIEQGLQMIESPLIEIESQQQQREQRLNETARDLQETAQDLMQRELRAQQRDEFLNSRELALSARAKVLDSRESGLWDMWVSLDKMDRKIKRARTWGIVIVIGIIALSGTAGYAVGHF